ncbi:22299_t:CDS:2 [Gigaspora rosea]|nr:22299_t:CDS:2 [Gigaspora rosea]
MKITSDTNLSKSDLEEVCRGLDIPTEGTKADLIQKIRDFSNEGNCEAEQSENMKKVYNENDDELTGKSKISTPKPATPNIKEQDPNITGKTSESPSCEHEGSETLEQKMLTAFKKLETSVLGFDNRLNSVTAQIQDTRQKVEINDAWPNHKFEKYRDQHEYDTLRLVGRDLDFAVESRNVHDAINCIESAREKIANRIFTLRVTEGYGWDIAAALPDTQDDWLKGKDSLIEKAKVLAEVKKNKRQKSGKSGKYGFQKGRTIGIRIQVPIGHFVHTANPIPALLHHQVNVTSVEGLGTSRTPARPTQMKAPPITAQEVIQPTKIDSANQMKLQEVIDYARAQQIIPVVGRLHMNEHVIYWEEKIQASGLVISWLKNGIPLYP